MDLLSDLKLSDIQVVGQSAERAIIFCFHVQRRRIICFDQHAVDERVRFEQLLDRMRPGDNLETIKSRACHHAIRFGDRLSLDECQKLFEQLLKCKVPFRCAHSRLSVCVLKNIDKTIYKARIEQNLEIDWSK